MRRSRHCCTHCTISVFSSMRATASARSRGDSSETIFRLALRLLVEFDHAPGRRKERLEPGDVVADVLDQLLIARGVRAVRLVDQRYGRRWCGRTRPSAAMARAAAGSRRTRSSRPGANAAARSGDRRDRAAVRSLSVSWNCDGLRPMLPVASAPIQRCMSSLRMSARVRPKSPPLQPPSVAPHKQHAREPGVTEAR